MLTILVFRNEVQNTISILSVHEGGTRDTPIVEFESTARAHAAEHGLDIDFEEFQRNRFASDDADDYYYKAVVVDWRETVCGPAHRQPRVEQWPKK